MKIDNRKKDERTQQVRQKMMDKITSAIQELGEQLQQDKTIPAKDKATQLDVLLDTLHFLDGYDENVPLLNEYWIKKRRKQKFEQSDNLEL